MIYETSILAQAGFPVLDIAEHFGVDRATIYRQRRYAADLLHTLKSGRDAFVALQADLTALEALEAAARMRESASQARALLEAVSAPSSPEDRAEQLLAVRGLPVVDRQESPVEPWPQDVSAGEPLPIDDPLKDWM